MITESVVFSGIYFNEAGFEYSAAELVESVDRGEPVVVYDSRGKLIGNMIAIRRVHGCLEGLIET